MESTCLRGAVSPILPCHRSPRKCEGRMVQVWAMRPVEGHPDRCLFQWLLDTDIKGWIPQSIIDKALSGTQFEYIANIRARARVLRAGQMLDSTVASCSDMAEGAPPTP